MTQAAQLASYGSSNVGLSFKNRIINGAMMIDQRNAGAAVTGNDTFPVDRFRLSYGNSSGAFSAQQSTTAPAGFINSLKYTTTTADVSLGATEYAQLYHAIEGLNVADLGWGSVNAQPVTLSFWCRSSVTGTFGGALRNSAGNRSYPFSYTISVADTWEYKSVTIAGDTSGTWLTTNGVGMYINIGMGVGSTYSGTAGTWASANYIGATGAVNLIATLNATFYITGVQLEKGSTATSFDYRPYGTELALCQRYYTKIFPGAAGVTIFVGGAGTATGTYGGVSLPVQMRVGPTSLDTAAANAYAVQHPNTGRITCSAVPGLGSVSPLTAWVGFTVASGLTAGGIVYNLTDNTNGASAYLGFGAEL